MFGIGGGEFIVIILVILMFFGSDKIPELARTLGKGMAQLRNATNDIKSEIHKNVNDAGLDRNTLTGGISEEISKAKEGFTKMVNESTESTGLKQHFDDVSKTFTDVESSPDVKIEPPINIDDIAEGPIKRQQ